MMSSMVDMTEIEQVSVFWCPTFQGMPKCIKITSMNMYIQIHIGKVHCFFKSMYIVVEIMSPLVYFQDGMI